MVFHRLCNLSLDFSCFNFSKIILSLYFLQYVNYNFAKFGRTVMPLSCPCIIWSFYCKMIYFILYTEKKEDAGKLTITEEPMKGAVDKAVILSYIKASGGYCVAFVVLLAFFLTVASQNAANLFLTHWLNQGSGVCGSINTCTPTVT